MKAKGLIAEIYRDNYSCSINKFNDLKTVLLPGAGPFEECEEYPAVKIVKRNIFPGEQPYIHAIPANAEPDEYFAFGGSFIYSSDSRFFENTGCRYPIPLHDRCMNLESNPPRPKQYLIFQEGSNTIRQMPENYLVAHFDNTQRCWICDPDLAAKEEFVLRTAKALLKWENKYQKDGNELLNRI